MFDTINGAHYFSTLDLAQRFWQIEMDEKSKPKTVFAMREGLFQFTFLPFSLANNPPTFERVMELLQRGIQWKQCLV